MSLPNLQILNLNSISFDFWQLTPIEMKQLTTLKIKLLIGNDSFFSSLSEAVKKMSVLSHLSVSEDEHNFCTNHICDMIETITS